MSRTFRNTPSRRDGSTRHSLFNAPTSLGSFVEAYTPPQKRFLKKSIKRAVRRALDTEDFALLKECESPIAPVVAPSSPAPANEMPPFSAFLASSTPKIPEIPKPEIVPQRTLWQRLKWWAIGLLSSVASLAIEYNPPKQWGDSQLYGG